MSDAKRLLAPRSPYWIHSAWMEWVALQEAPDRHDSTLQHPIPINGVLRIDRTGRVKAAGRTQHGRQTSAIDGEKADTHVSHDEGSPKRANRCLRNVLRHTVCSSTNGTFRQSRFGNTRKACPAINAGRTARPNSRNSRFARFRRTAVPNRLPMTIPIIASCGIMPGEIWRLNNPTETRRPLFLISWMSRLRVKKNGADARPAVITDLSADYRVRPRFIEYTPRRHLVTIPVLP